MTWVVLVVVVEHPSSQRIRLEVILLRWATAVLAGGIPAPGKRVVQVVFLVAVLVFLLQAEQVGVTILLAQKVVILVLEILGAHFRGTTALAIGFLGLAAALLKRAKVMEVRAVKAICGQLTRRITVAAVAGVIPLVALLLVD
jgi:hypothetical protein